jgi:ATP-binding cassette subfamily B protein
LARRALARAGHAGRPAVSDAAVGGPARGPRHTLRTLRRLLPFLRPYRRRLTLGLVLVVVSAAVGAVVPWVLRAAVDGLRAGAPPGRAWALAGVMLAAALVGGAMRYGMREILNGVSRLVETDLRDAVFAHLLTLDAAAAGRWRTGELMARLTNDLSAVRMAAGPAIMYLVNTVAGGAFALVFMLRIDARLTGLALLPMVGLPYVMVRLGRLVHDRFEAVQAHFGVLTTRAQENLAGTRVVRAYGQEAAEAARFDEVNAEYARRNVALARLNGVMNPAFGLLAGVGAAVVLGVGGTLALDGRITVGAFVAFGLYLAMLTWPLIALGWVTNLFQRGAASMARITELLDARPELASPAAPRPLPPRAPGRPGRVLEFRGVSFAYPARPAAGGAGAPDGADPGPAPAPRRVLRDVSFTVPAGATVGVVGPVGSGKSTLLELVPRLFDPQEGEVLLDGVPLRALDPDALRREIGFVPQESLLFSDTLASNIAYGVPDGSDGDAGVPPRLAEAAAGSVEPTGHDVVAWAADIAHLTETVADFPGGFETVLGERGVNLSGGQKQRAAIARALARRPSVVLLDDALSAVDTQTEAAILRGLRSALAGRTTLIATHRVSAVRDAAFIVVLDDGRAVEQGTHDELVAAGGRYATLVRRQQLEADVDAADPDGGAPDGGAPDGGAADDGAGDGARASRGAGGAAPAPAGATGS